MVRNVSLLGEQNCGIAFQLSQSRHPPKIASKSLFRDNCGGGACGGGAGCPWVAGRLGANGGHVLIAVRTGLAWRVAWGRLVLALQGLPPFENSRIRFIFLSFILFSICI